MLVALDHGLHLVSCLLAVCRHARPVSFLLERSQPAMLELSLRVDEPEIRLRGENGDAISGEGRLQIRAASHSRLSRARTYTTYLGRPCANRRVAGREIMLCFDVHSVVAHLLLTLLQCSGAAQALPSARTLESAGGIWCPHTSSPLSLHSHSLIPSPLSFDCTERQLSTTRSPTQARLPFY